MNEQQIPWREMIAVVHRRRRFILQVFLGGFITVAIGIWTQEPSYRATATLMVTSDRAQIIVSPDANTRPTVERVTDADMNSEVALIRSEALIRDVLAPYWHESAEESPSFFKRLTSTLTFPLRIPSLLYGLLHTVPPVTGLDSWVTSTAANLGVGQVGKSNLIEVSYYSASPKWAAEFVNKLVALSTTTLVAACRRARNIDAAENVFRPVTTNRCPARPTIGSLSAASTGGRDPISPP